MKVDVLFTLVDGLGSRPGSSTLRLLAQMLRSPVDPSAPKCLSAHLMLHL